MQDTNLPDPGPDGPLFFKELASQGNLTTSRKRGVIYARYSSDMQNSSESIEVQISECKKYGLAHGILICRKPFVDRAETGTSTENRKAYQELFALARSSERDFDIILTFHTSRWGRVFKVKSMNICWNEAASRLSPSANRSPPMTASNPSS